MKSGLVAVVGKPNVGKSTFLNKVIGKKVSIVSRRPATTRIKVLGIITRAEKGQIIFIDTPGFEKAKNTFGKLMLRAILSSVKEVDVVLFLIDAKGWKEEDEEILKVLRNSNKKIILGINKVDRVSDKKLILPLIEKSSRKYNFAEIVPFSALEDQNLNSIEKIVFAHLPEGELFFPPDTSTNLSQKYLVAEIIREKIFEKTYQEVPQGVAVEVDEITPGSINKEALIIKATIIIDRKSLKPIIIGKDGRKLKAIGKFAREELQDFFGKKIYLELWVKVIKDWKERPDVFRRFGYGTE